MRKYLDIPRGTVFTMRIVPDCSCPKRWYCQDVSLLIDFRNKNDRLFKMRRYVVGEGIQFAFRYY